MGLSRLSAVNKRRSDRRKMLKGGVIAYSGRHATLPCVVRDMSDSGSRLQVSETAAIPDTFELIVELDGLEVPCEVVWREKNRVGVKFTGEPTLVAPARAQIVNSVSTTESKPTLRRSKTPPATEQQRSATTLPEEQAENLAKRPAATNARSIPLLIADDDADDRFLIADALKESHFEHPVNFVEDGVELLKYLRREAPFEACTVPGLILLDLNMPRMDGHTALQNIKTDPDLKRIPVIVFTTSNAEADIERTYELGVSAFITKPNTFDETIELIQSLNDHWMRFVALPTVRA